MSTYRVRPMTDTVLARAWGAEMSRFRAHWSATEELLLAELDHIEAVNVVLELSVGYEDIRVDGRIRANARPLGDAVRLSCHSTSGPLQFTSKQFNGWRDNVRAIALTLQSLRAVNRYGVAGSGEQYRGWTAIEAGPS